MGSTEYPEYRHTTVKDLEQDEQPREKLQRYGAESLSNAELLAILLRTGSNKLNVIETSRMLIRNFGSLHRMAGREWQELRSIKGIGNVKAITLSAVFELARRLQTDHSGSRITMRTPEDVVGYFGPKLRDLRKEHFIVVYLNAAKIMIGYKTISMGGQTSTVVDTPEVMRNAIMNDANSIVVLHNHPSGNVRPSESDLKLTYRIKESGKLLGIPLEDHIIIGGFDYTSLRHEGFFDKKSSN